MHLSVVSSLDSQCREAATTRLGRTHRDSVVVLHDLLDGSIVLRRIFRNGELVEQARTALEHGCLSCTVRLDVVPTAQRFASSGHDHIVLGLPPGVSVDMVVAELKRGLGWPAVIDNAVLAIDPSGLEDHIWDKHTLYESGFTAMPEDERTSGEFLIGELGHADTVMVHAGLGAELAGLHPDSSEAWAQALELLGQLAPHAAISASDDDFQPGCYDGAEALARVRRGSVRVPLKEDSGSFRTVLHKVERPLHPERFQAALPQVGRGMPLDAGPLVDCLGGQGPDRGAGNRAARLAREHRGVARGRRHRHQSTMRKHEKENPMKVRNSLRALKKIPGAQVVRRRGRTFVINKLNPRFKARQG